MRTRAAPFPETPVGAVHFAIPWQIGVAGGYSALGDDVPAWDFQAVLRLSAALSVDRSGVLAACHLGQSTVLLVVVRATSSTTKMRGLVARGVVESSGAPVSLTAEVHGHELGGRLFLDTMLVATSIERIDVLSPISDATILWRDRRATWLEGESGRFPTEVADLSSAPFFTPGALWFLDIRADDLDAAALGAIRLVLNEKHPIIGRILAGDASPEVLFALSALRWDIARQLVSAALESEEFVDREGLFEEDTLGSVMARLAALLWPGESARVLRQVRQLEPARFERELQDGVGLFRD